MSAKRRHPNPRSFYTMTKEHQTSEHSILLVDDDPGFRRLCRMALEKVGYLISEADSSNAALKVWGAQPQTIDLLVTDFEMPGLTGLQLAQLLREQRPTLPVLLISGREIAVPPRIAFLQKPFTARALSETVGQFFHPPH